MTIPIYQMCYSASDNDNSLGLFFPSELSERDLSSILYILPIPLKISNYHQLLSFYKSNRIVIPSIVNGIKKNLKAEFISQDKIVVRIPYKTKEIKHSGIGLLRRRNKRKTLKHRKFSFEKRDLKKVFYHSLEFKILINEKEEMAFGISAKIKTLMPQLNEIKNKHLIKYVGGEIDFLIPNQGLLILKPLNINLMNELFRSSSTILVGKTPVFIGGDDDGSQGNEYGSLGDKNEGNNPYENLC